MIKHHVTSKCSQHSSGQSDFLPESSVFLRLILVVVCLLEIFLPFFIVRLCVEKNTYVFFFNSDFYFPVL